MIARSERYKYRVWVADNNSEALFGFGTVDGNQRPRNLCGYCFWSNKRLETPLRRGIDVLEFLLNLDDVCFKQLGDSTYRKLINPLP